MEKSLIFAVHRMKQKRAGVPLNVRQVITKYKT